MGLGIETWLRKVIAKYQMGYRYRSDHHVVNDYIEFSGLKKHEVIENMKSYKNLTRHDWNQSQESWGKKTEHFYATSRNYIYDLLVNNFSRSSVEKKLNGFNPQILQLIKDHPGKSSLEFGGGLGVFCDLAASFGKQVTYLDIPGHVYDFAAWRFMKYRLPIEMICSNPLQLRLERDYDIIFTDAAFEHLIDPPQVLGELLTHVKPGGLFIFLVDLEGHTEELPMHRDIDIKSLHELIATVGLDNVFGLNTFGSIWRRPMESLHAL